MKESNKQLKKEYQQTPRPLGVFLIRNNLNDRVFLGAGPDIHGAINRHKFQLSSGVHPSKELQADWNQFGSEKFSFEIVDEVTPQPGVTMNYRSELETLEKLWLEKLQPYGERGYNTRKLSRAELLRRIGKDVRESTKN